LISVDLWRDVQTRLLDHADADRTLKNPSRVMRLPGARYAIGKDKLGEQCRVIGGSGATYRVEEIEECLSAPAQTPSDLPIDSKLGVGDEPFRAPFKCLGFNRGMYYYFPKGTCQVVALQKAAHTATALLEIAPLTWWKDVFPRCTKAGDVIGVEWQEAIDWTFREQQMKGVFDIGKVRGLGAWWDDQRVVMHLGNRLVVQGVKRPLWEGIESEYIYDGAAKLEGPGGEEPLTDEEGMRLLALCEGFHWEQSSAGMLLAGWVALAPVCGAMRWRPHLWMTAAAGAGKSTILERLVKVLLGDLVIAPGSNATEAGIRQALQSSALPIVFDEAESNDQHEAARMQAVLGLARFASSEGSAQILKGTATGEGTSYRVRTMFLLSSVATALKHGADKTRFSQLTLIKPHGMSQEDIQARWRLCDRELYELITPQAGLRLIARSVALIPMLRDALEVFAKACAAHMGSTRLGDQYGALCAGAWSLEHQRVPTAEEATAWLEKYPLGDFAEQSEAADERDCWQTITQSQLQVDLERVITDQDDQNYGTVVVGHVKRTILSLMHTARGTNPDRADPVTARVAVSLLGRHGIRVEGETVLVGNGIQALKALLRNTPWQECYPNMLKRVEGARPSPKSIRFSGVGIARATELPFPLDPANLAEPEPSH
jgi:putative DNA primase/helicase